MRSGWASGSLVERLAPLGPAATPRDQRQEWESWVISVILVCAKAALSYHSSSPVNQAHPHVRLSFPSEVAIMTSRPWFFLNSFMYTLMITVKRSSIYAGGLTSIFVTSLSIQVKERLCHPCRQSRDFICAVLLYRSLTGSLKDLRLLLLKLF